MIDDRFIRDILTMGAGLLIAVVMLAPLTLVNTHGSAPELIVCMVVFMVTVLALIFAMLINFIMIYLIESNVSLNFKYLYRANKYSDMFDMYFTDYKVPILVCGWLWVSLWWIKIKDVAIQESIPDLNRSIYAIQLLAILDTVLYLILLKKNNKMTYDIVFKNLKRYKKNKGINASIPELIFDKRVKHIYTSCVDDDTIMFIDDYNINKSNAYKQLGDLVTNSTIVRELLDTVESDYVYFIDKRGYNLFLLYSERNKLSE